jgi:hypothetical protein
MSTKKRNVSESLKKHVAGNQNFKCANNPEANIKGLDGYECPKWKFNQGSFDTACYEIDHIKEHCLTHDDSIGNLQALCHDCHAVKTRLFKITQTQQTWQTQQTQQDITQTREAQQTQQAQQAQQAQQDITQTRQTQQTQQDITKTQQTQQDTISNFQCSVCNRNFAKKSHFINHTNKKNKCQPINTTHENPIILPDKPPNFQCSVCNRNFTKKSHLINHTNKKNKCQPINTLPEKSIILPENPIILINNKKCKYCNKLFGRKDTADTHMKQYCPIIKQQNNKLTALEEKNKQLEDEFNKLTALKEKNKQLEDETNNIYSINNNIINNTINDNSINDNSITNTINIINIDSHGNKDLTKNKLNELLLILTKKRV